MYYKDVKETDKAPTDFDTPSTRENGKSIHKVVLIMALWLL